MAYAEKSYIGKGVAYLDGLDVGNVSELKFGIESDKKTQPNFRTSGGGNLNSLERITSVTASITFTDFLTDNLVKGLRATSSAVSATTVTDESIAAPASLTDDPLVETANVIDTGATVTVTSDPSGTTYTAGTDYTVNAAGIQIIDGGGISASDPLLISYTKKAVDVIEALTAAAAEYRMVFAGLNEAQSDDPFVVYVHRLKFGPASELSLVADDYGNLVLTGELLADTTYDGSSTSQYFVAKAA